MRTGYHHSLDSLAVDLADMCGRASAMMQSATVALLEADSTSAETLRDKLTGITALGAAVHDRAYKLLALQAPVARDLRTVVSALQIAADADRMGALASHVARTALRRHPQRAVPAEVLDLFSDMGATAVRLAAQAGAAVRSGDAGAAERVCAGDERMDDLHRELFTRVIGPRWLHGPLVAADLVLLGRFYERFADHTVEIARRVYFQATGAHMADSGRRA